MNKCECENFICLPVEDSPNSRIRLNKGESGHINGSNVIETSLADCEIKHYGQYKAAIAYKIGEVTLKTITEEFMKLKGWHYDED